MPAMGDSPRIVISLSEVPQARPAVQNLPAVQEIRVPALVREDPLEKGMATHSGILAWRIPWTEEGCRPWDHKDSDVTE